MNKVLIFGYGYVARFLSEKIIANGNTVLATTRDSNKISAQFDKLTLIHPDKVNPKLNDHKDEITHLIVSVPPNETGDVFLKQYKDEVDALLEPKKDETSSQLSFLKDDELTPVGRRKRGRKPKKPAVQI